MHFVDFDGEAVVLIFINRHDNLSLTLAWVTVRIEYLKGWKDATEFLSF
jgi:hypothetical protein